MRNTKNLKTGRINLTGECYSFANMLQIGDEDFWSNIEEGIRPLVKIFVDNGIETYSSCHGHFDNDLEDEFPNIIFYSTPYIARKIFSFIESLGIKFSLDLLKDIVPNPRLCTYLLTIYPSEKSRDCYDETIKDLCDSLIDSGLDCFKDNRVDNWSLLVKPTNDCNLDCKYCYEKPVREKLHGCRLSYDDIEHILKLATDYSKRVTWIWHGGEPTLMGTDWYIGVQDLFYKYSEFSLITQNMQTNGTKLDPSWAKINTEFGIGIGVSYDGLSQDVRVGRDTLNVKDNIKSFKSCGGDIGGICVVSSKNCDKQIDIYKHYANDLGIGVSLNHIFHSDGVVEGDLEPSFEKFGKEYEKFLDFYCKSEEVNRFSERTAETFIGLVFGKLGGVCSHSDCRYGWVGINSDGSLYPCDRHLPDRYSMGNVRDFNDVPSIYETSNYKLYDLEIEKRKFLHCNDCGFYSYCSGGCNATHIAKAGDGSGIDEFSCNLLKMQFATTYLYFRNVDIYSDDLSPIVLNLILKEGFITLKEIEEFIRGKDIVVNLQLDCSSPKSILDSKEFKLFRLFNPLKGKGGSFHYDGINVNSISGVCDEKCIQLREKKLSKMFSQNYSEIIKLINGEV